ncbi:hypothetical protein [Jiangella gansuensis]|nr:hypothetical protein [Jiangella gansuensis]
MIEKSFLEPASSPSRCVSGWPAPPVRELGSFGLDDFTELTTIIAEL